MVTEKNGISVQNEVDMDEVSDSNVEITVRETVSSILLLKIKKIQKTICMKKMKKTKKVNKIK